MTYIALINAEGVVEGLLYETSTEEADQWAAVSGGTWETCDGDRTQPGPYAVVDGQLVPHPTLAPAAQRREAVARLADALTQRERLRRVEAEGVDVTTELAASDAEVARLKTELS